MIKSISLWFAVCILVRLTLVFIVYLQSYKDMMMIIYGAIAAGLAYQFLRNNRKLGAFGQKVWWQNFRLFHVMVYLAVIFMIHQKMDVNVIVAVLLLDLIVAIIGHINFNYFRVNA